MDILKDKYFHLYINNEIEKQGKIIGKVEDGYYMVQFYDFLIGEPNNMKIYSLEELKKYFIVYETAEDMIESYGRIESSQ